MPPPIPRPDPEATAWGTAAADPRTPDALANVAKLMLGNPPGQGEPYPGLSTLFPAMRMVGANRDKIQGTIERLQQNIPFWMSRYRSIPAPVRIMPDKQMGDLLGSSDFIGRFGFQPNRGVKIDLNELLYQPKAGINRSPEAIMTHETVHPWLIDLPKTDLMKWAHLATGELPRAEVRAIQTSGQYPNERNKLEELVAIMMERNPDILRVFHNRR